MKRVVFYTEDPVHHHLGSQVKNDVVERLNQHEHLNIDGSIDLGPKRAIGFRSGINWEKKRDRNDVVAIVLYRVDQACKAGIYLEASAVGLKVYVFDAGTLCRINGPGQTSQNPVTTYYNK